MKKRGGAVCASILLASLLAGCSMLDALNPFSANGPRMAELLPIKASMQARVSWRESVGKSAPYVFTPAVVGSSIYAASAEGSLLRIDNGRVTWKVNAGLPLSGGVGSDGALVLVGSPKGDVLAFSANDGKLLWKARATSEILSPPVVGGGVVVVRSGDNRLAGYDVQDGKRKWIYQRPTPALFLREAAPPIIDHEYVFAGFPGGKLIALSIFNGAVMWEGTVALPKGTTELDRVADITSAPVISGRSICAVAFQGRVACFSLDNGELTWARDMSSSSGLTIDSRNLYVSDDKGAVHALDMASGASLWKQDKLFLRRLTSPVVRGAHVLVADVEGVVHFLNKEDGSFAARVSTDGSPVVAPMQVLGSGVLVQTNKGGLYALEAE